MKHERKRFRKWENFDVDHKSWIFYNEFERHSIEDQALGLSECYPLTKRII